MCPSMPKMMIYDKTMNNNKKKQIKLLQIYQKEKMSVKYKVINTCIQGFNNFNKIF